MTAAIVASPWDQAAFGQSKRRIRVGQIGTKHGHAGGKCEAIKKLSEDFELVGVVEEDQTLRERAQSASSFSGCTWMTTDQLLGQPGLELVLVETDIDHLLSTAEQCLSARMHVHLDKPAGTSLDHFRRVAKMASDQKRILQMGYMFRSNSAFQFLFEAVNQGWLGEIFEVHGVMSKKLALAERADVARYRGGSMFELGCHLIDVVVKLLGRPQSIVATNRMTHPEVDTLRDNCLVLFQYPKATATVRSSFVEVDGNRRRQFSVCGTQGTIEINPLEPPQLTLTLDRPQGDFSKGTQVVPLPKMNGRYDGDFLALAAAIRGESSYPYSSQHDLLVQQCVLEASEMQLATRP